jgi:hypothetical protein
MNIKSKSSFQYSTGSSSKMTLSHPFQEGSTAETDPRSSALAFGRFKFRTRAWTHPEWWSVSVWYCTLKIMFFIRTCPSFWWERLTFWFWIGYEVYFLVASTLALSCRDGWSWRYFGIFYVMFWFLTETTVVYLCKNSSRLSDCEVHTTHSGSNRTCEYFSSNLAMSSNIICRKCLEPRSYPDRQQPKKTRNLSSQVVIASFLCCFVHYPQI